MNVKIENQETSGAEDKRLRWIKVKTDTDCVRRLPVSLCRVSDVRSCVGAQVDDKRFLLRAQITATRALS